MFFEDVAAEYLLLPFTLAIIATRLVLVAVSKLPADTSAIILLSGSQRISVCEFSNGRRTRKITLAVEQVCQVSG